MKTLGRHMLWEVKLGFRYGRTNMFALNQCDTTAGRRLCSNDNGMDVILGCRKWLPITYPHNHNVKSTQVFIVFIWLTFSSETTYRDDLHLQPLILICQPHLHSCLQLGHTISKQVVVS